ncbi:MAG TPA: S1C family serine protease [Candidatus Binataceae bacterium]|nr:S1C family serine protease [Candidatus Binataceae bacterium]
MNARPALLEHVARATVGVHSQVPETHVSAAIGLGTDRRGTGTIVSSDGLILTVHYMLLGAQNVIVTLVNGDQLPAKVVAKDYSTGLGLLKIDGSKYPRVEVVSAENCTQGQEIFSVASHGGEKRCADCGVITYTGPFDAVWEFMLDRCLCVTASSLNLGMAGGPVCNSRGELIGVTCLNFADMGRAILAIPGDCVLQTRDELIKYGHRVTAPSKAWIGVLSYTMREHVVIAGVMPGGPGEKAGLQQGDLVITVDGQDINERRALYESLRNHGAGDTVKFKVLRNNRVLNLEIPSSRAEDYFA